MHNSHTNIFRKQILNKWITFDDAFIELRTRLAATEWSRPKINEAIKAIVGEHKLKLPKIAMPLRVMVTGEAQTPSIDATLELIGRDEVLARMDKQLQAFPA